MMALSERKDQIRIGLNLSGSYVTLVDPTIRVLQDCIKNKEWCKGIVFATTFFEHFGFHRLDELYREKLCSEDLRRLNLGEIIILLFVSGVIDKSTYAKMKEISNFRNKIVHGRFKRKKALVILRVDPKKGEQLIKQSIECLDSLGVH